MTKSWTWNFVGTNSLIMLMIASSSAFEVQSDGKIENLDGKMATLVFLVGKFCCILKSSIIALRKTSLEWEKVFECACELCFQLCGSWLVQFSEPGIWAGYFLISPWVVSCAEQESEFSPLSWKRCSAWNWTRNGSEVSHSNSFGHMWISSERSSRQIYLPSVFQSPA